MEDEDRDIVTLLVENYVEADHLKTVLDDAGLSDMMYVHDMNTEWPTLIELINMEKRLVVFWEQSGDSDHPYFHDFLEFGWTTDYANDDTGSMDCDPHRGDSNQPVYHMNNWLKNQAGLVGLHSELQKRMMLISWSREPLSASNNTESAQPSSPSIGGKKAMLLKQLNLSI